MLVTSGNLASYERPNYESGVRPFLFYHCETLSLRVEDQRYLEIFGNHYLHCILGCRRRDLVSVDILRHRLHLRALLPTLLQRRLRWFSHAALRPTSKIIRDVIDPVPPTPWRRKRDGQPEILLTMLKEDLAWISGPNVYGLRQWNRAMNTLSRSLQKMIRSRKSVPISATDILNPPTSTSYVSPNCSRRPWNEHRGSFTRIFSITFLRLSNRKAVYSKLCDTAVQEQDIRLDFSLVW